MVNKNLVQLASIYAKDREVRGSNPPPQFVLKKSIRKVLLFIKKTCLKLGCFTIYWVNIMMMWLKNLNDKTMGCQISGPILYENLGSLDIVLTSKSTFWLIPKEAQQQSIANDTKLDNWSHLLIWKVIVCEWTISKIFLIV